jgi:hypothetical protein
MDDGFINLDTMDDDRLYKRIKEFEKHRDNGYYYTHDFKCKLSLDIESDKPYYILDYPDNVIPVNKFETAFNIEAKLDRTFYWLRFGDWKTALFHIGQLKPDKHISQAIIDDITKDIRKYITNHYNASHNTVEDVSSYNTTLHTTLTIKKKPNNI